MKLFTTKEQLITSIVSYGKKVVEANQIASRLKKLLPNRLKEIMNKYQNSSSVSKASRLALCDRDYKKYVLEYLEIKEQAYKNRVLWETHKMYFYMKKYKNH